MPKFKIGETVKKNKGGAGTIRAIFTTMDGEQRYAVENEGALDFIRSEIITNISDRHGGDVNGGRNQLRERWSIRRP